MSNCAACVQLRAPKLCVIHVLFHCSKMMEELDWYEREAKRLKLPMRRPNSMNNYGLVLNDIGFNAFMEVGTPRLTISLLRFSSWCCSGF